MMNASNYREQQLRFLQHQKQMLKCEYDEEKRRLPYDNQLIVNAIKNRQIITDLKFISSRGDHGKFIVIFGLDKDQDSNLGIRSSVKLGCESSSKGLFINPIAIDSNSKIKIRNFGHMLDEQSFTFRFASSSSIEDDNLRILGHDGIISKVNKYDLEVFFNSEIQLEESVKYFLIQSSSDVTYTRLIGALDFVSLELHSGNNKIVDQLFGLARFNDKLSSSHRSLTFVNKNLNGEQKDSVEFAIDQTNTIAIIHGPPGTGKTTTLIEIILQCAINFGKKLLVTAPSNVAVDNLLDKLASWKHQNQQHDFNLIRIGQQARIKDNLRKYHLDYILYDKKITAEDKQEARSHLLNDADVVMATLTSTATLDNKFDYLIIDECSQAIEAHCYVPLALIKSKVILAGDHLQLPPTVLSQAGKNGNLECSLMEKLCEMIRTRTDLGSDKYLVRMLCTQYRMNSDIMSWSSMKFYDSKMIAHASVAHHTLADLVPSYVTKPALAPLVLIDTVGNGKEIKSGFGSYGNEYEAAIVSKYASQLVHDYRIDASDIGVISPYKFQVTMISRILSDKSSIKDVEVSSVDGFQGREKEVIIISCVRSNDNFEVGFLSESRRMNVAVTRPKRHLVVICNVATLSGDAHLRSLIDYLKDGGETKFGCEFVLPEDKPSLKEYFQLVEIDFPSLKID